MERFPKEYKWMAGRQVFERPESRGSIMAKRDIIDSPEQHDEVTRAHVRSTLARQALSAEDIEEEITAYDRLDRGNPLEI